MPAKHIPARRGSNSSGVGARTHHGGHTMLGRHPDRERLVRIADSMRRMHTHPNTQTEPLTDGERATMRAHADELHAIADKPAES